MNRASRLTGRLFFYLYGTTFRGVCQRSGQGASGSLPWAVWKRWRVALSVTAAAVPASRLPPRSAAGQRPTPWDVAAPKGSRQAHNQKFAESQVSPPLGGAGAQWAPFRLTEGSVMPLACRPAREPTFSGTPPSGKSAALFP